jgi:hypothetical protein
VGALQLTVAQIAGFEAPPGLVAGSPFDPEARAWGDAIAAALATAYRERPAGQCGFPAGQGDLPTIEAAPPEPVRDSILVWGHIVQ